MKRREKKIEKETWDSNLHIFTDLHKKSTFWQSFENFSINWDLILLYRKNIVCLYNLLRCIRELESTKFYPTLLKKDVFFYET